MAEKSFEVAVIGGGPGGYVAGIRLGQLGKKAVVIEREHLGGVCLNWGCIPSKALIHAAHLVGELHESSELGIEAKEVTVDATKLQAWKDGIVKKQRGGVKQLLQSNHCEHIKGEARITGPKTLEVKLDNGGGTDTIRFEQLIIATGAGVIEIPGFPYDEDVVGYARHGVSYAPVPPRLVIIGGGVIGSELGMVYGKLGSKVTIVEMLPNLLTGTDPDLVRPVAKRMKKIGIEVLLNAKAKGMSKNGKIATVEVEVGGEIKKFEAEKVLVAVGFKPANKTLGLEAAGVKTDEKGWIKVDDRCRTNVPHVYAIGDCTGGPLLAHRASRMGETAAEVIAGHPAAFDVRAMPLAVFSDPEVAQAGLTEEQAKAAGYEVAVGMFPMSALGRAATMNATDGLVKLVMDKKTEVVLGIGIAAANACDLIAEACLAIEMGALADDIGLTVHAHPTLSEGLMEAAKAAKGEAVHIVNRTGDRPRAAGRAHA
ncbi:MAG: dihydrolipoyl dehydrogenase [Myxococcota bacterium]